MHLNHRGPCRDEELSVKRPAIKLSAGIGYKTEWTVPIGYNPGAEAV